MNWERFAFPAIVVAAIVGIWYALRGTAPAVASAPAASMQASGALPPMLLYLPPARLDPPATLDHGPYPNTLKYPADLTTAEAVGTDPSFVSDASCGCC